MKQFALSLLSATILLGISCNTSSTEKTTETKMEHVPAIRSADVTYMAGDSAMIGYVAMDSAISGKRPVVLIVHEWWGLNDYVRSRANQLAGMGYLAIAVDMYGNRKQGPDPGTAGKLATALYEDPELARTRFDAALQTILKYPEADASRVAAIGYCFGGSMVLNMAKMGEPLNGVVSFHGNLAGVKPAGPVKASILVCHGEADQFVPAEEIVSFKKEMDSVKADYTFKTYPGATHAFTNPDATAKGKQFNIPIAYNAAADSASWNDMKVFFGKIFK